MTSTASTSHPHRAWLSACQLICALAMACGSSGESSGGLSASECEQRVDEYIARVSECLVVTAEQRHTAIEQCTSGELPPGALAVQWRPEFSAHVDTCSDALRCEQLLEDWDDLCFPQALALLAPGQLSTATIDACIRGELDTCRAQLKAQPETEANVTGACFNLWLTCQPELASSDAQWTEDHCSMTLALTDAARVEAQSCLELACADVAGCLRELGALNF